MKTNLPARELEVCDFCHREGYLQDCWVCGKQFCLSDEGTVVGSFGFTKVCRVCSSRDDVQLVCGKFAKLIGPILRKRDAALKNLS